MLYKPRILSLFLNSFNKFNNVRSSIYSGCDKRPVEDETKYAVHVGLGRWLDMPCAPGTAFNPVDCRCSLTLMNIPGKVRQQGKSPLKPIHDCSRRQRLTSNRTKVPTIVLT